MSDTTSTEEITKKETATPPPSTNPPENGSNSRSKKKRKKKKAEASSSSSSAAAGGGGEGEGIGEEAEAGADEEDDEVAKKLAALHVAGVEEGAVAGDQSKLTVSYLQQMLNADYYRSMGKQEKSQEQFQFWSTQPVLKMDENPEENGPIEDKTPADVRQEPYKLPEGYKWSELDMKLPQGAKEVYDLLNKNYVEDDDNMFRFDYSPAFLEWALTPPGSRKEFVVGIRVAKAGGKLVGFITGVPVHMRVYDKTMPMVEINFLCVLKKLRSKRLAPVLIKEITRRVNLTGVWQAVYTAGVVLPKPVARCRYFHRLLKPKKLIDIGFTRLAPRMNMARTIRLYQLPDSPSTGIRPMVAADVPSAKDLINTHLANFKLAPVFTEEDFAHWLLPRPDVIDAFVITNEDGIVTDMCSFYHLPSTVIGNEKDPKLSAVYSFYNVATTMPIKELMREALVLAKERGVDVFNALDIMDNSEFLSDLKFGQGDGNLQYYVYNWKCPEMKPNEVGLVLL